LILLCCGVGWFGGCASTNDDDLNAALTVIDLRFFRV